MSEAKKSTTDRILDAALDLFVAEGFVTTPMDIVAERAGVAKGTLYYHYKSKEGIVDALIGRYVALLRAELEPIVSDPSLDFFAKYAAMDATLSRVNHQTFSRLHKLRYIDIHQKTTLAAIDTLTPFYLRLIQDGARDGVCKAESGREFVEIIVTASQFLLDPEYGTERLKARSEALIRLSEKLLGLPPGSLKGHDWTDK